MVDKVLTVTVTLLSVLLIFTAVHVAYPYIIANDNQNPALQSSSLKNRRNVLLLFADDYGMDSSVYGNTKVHTPALHYLSQNGVTFDRAYTSVSLCSPSRSALLTGLPPHQTGMYGVRTPDYNFASPNDIRSLPVMLSKHNIKTGIIGKKHIGPDNVYAFDFSKTEDDYPMDVIGRNITLIKEHVRSFLSTKNTKPFFLYVAFHDTHRGCIAENELFCEQMGNGQPGKGKIPDWKPKCYKPEDVEVPYFIPNTSEARRDLSAYYTSVNRMDQGINLVLEELKASGHLKDTLVIFTSDNGMPFPSGKVNLYDTGMQEPFIVSSPKHKAAWGQRNKALISHLDMTPTILDWFGIRFEPYTIYPNKSLVQLTGKSLLPLLDAKPGIQQKTSVFASHTFSELANYYPMRAVRNDRYKLIHNLDFKMPFGPPGFDLVGPTFVDQLQRAATNQTLHWFKTLHQYYYRDQWELFDTKLDPRELNNVRNNPQYSKIFTELQTALKNWQTDTQDQWRCLPTGSLLHNSVCVQLYNEIE